PLLVHLVEDAKLLLGVQTVRDGARVEVPHGEHLDGRAVLAGDQAAALVRELPETVLDHLLVEDGVQLDHCTCNNSISAVIFPIGTAASGAGRRATRSPAPRGRSAPPGRSPFARCASRVPPVLRAPSRALPGPPSR